jgi:hypothetical protein
LFIVGDFEVEQVTFLHPIVNSSHEDRESMLFVTWEVGECRMRDAMMGKWSVAGIN